MHTGTDVKSNLFAHMMPSVSMASNLLLLCEVRVPRHFRSLPCFCRSARLPLIVLTLSCCYCGDYRIQVLLAPAPPAV